MAKTQIVTLEIPQGATYKHYITYPMNLTGYDVRMQFRESASSDVVLFTGTNATDDIFTVGEFVNGTTTISMVIPATVSSEDWDFQRAVYDIEIESSGGEITRLMQGSVIVDPEVTRMN